MIEADYDIFVNKLSAIAGMRDRTVTEWTIGIWWAALARYDLAAVEDALIRHVQNPDNGTYMPQPADIIKLIGGTTMDAAMMAWAKVEMAVKLAGPYADVAFDDALIHRVIEDMGGWAWFGTQTEKEWPFVGKNFQNLYRGYRTRSDLGDYKPVLTGTYNTYNHENGFSGQPPMLIGDPAGAARVMRGGSFASRIGLQQAAPQLMRSMPHARLPASFPRLPDESAAEIIDINSQRKGKRA